MIDEAEPLAVNSGALSLTVPRRFEAAAETPLEIWCGTAHATGGPARPGEGRRLVRKLQAEGRCCSRPVFSTEAITGRYFCCTCRFWWNASHSARIIVAARCARPVGVDVQVHSHRPAALRWLERTTNASFPLSIAHWTLAEAYWKGIGMARHMPTVGAFTLPEFIAAGWGSHVFSGTAESLYLFKPGKQTSFAAVLPPDTV